MQTITFYSYKGGVGRTLAVANVAKYLAQFGQRVVALDFDLEAPGLHYKLGLDKENWSPQIKKGVLDYTCSFYSGEGVPKALHDYVVEVAPSAEGRGSIHLMPAGNVLSSQYWRRLSQINWHEFFYADGARGIPFFLELKAQIEEVYKPDFLLVDSRTGVTEIGGVATILMPDKLVCLLLSNRENLEGARRVLRSIKSVPRLPGQGPPEILPVVARIPKLERPDVEEYTVQGVQDFLNEEAESLSETLSIPEVFILHSEPELQYSEALRIGGDKSPDESPLLRDYLRLFARLISQDIIEPYLNPLIGGALDRSWDDPAGSQRDLETLAASYPHPEAYRALLKFYRLRSANRRVLIQTAARLWELEGKADEAILWDVIRENYNDFGPHTDYPITPAFVEEVWRVNGANDIEIGLNLARHYQTLDDADRALSVLRLLLKEVGPVEEVVVACIDQRRRAGNWEEAFETIKEWKEKFLGSEAFQRAWAKLIVDKEDEGEAEEFLEIHIRPSVIERDIETYARLLRLAGKNEELNAFAERELSKIIERGGGRRDFLPVHQIFFSLNRTPEFEKKVRQSMGDDANDLLRFLRRRPRLRDTPWIDF